MNPPRRRLLLFVLPILSLIVLLRIFFAAPSPHSHLHDGSSADRRVAFAGEDNDDDPKLFESAAALIRKAQVSVVPAFMFPPIGHEREVHEQFLIVCAGQAPPPPPPKTTRPKKSKNNNKDSTTLDADIAVVITAAPPTTPPPTKPPRKRDIVCQNLAESGRFEHIVSKRIDYFLRQMVAGQLLHGDQQFNWANFLEEENKARLAQLAGHNNKKAAAKPEEAADILAKFEKEAAMERKKRSGGGNKKSNLMSTKNLLGKKNSFDDDDDDVDQLAKRSKRIFIDIGANVGVHTFSMSPLFDAVLAIDAVEDNVRMMKATRAINFNYGSYRQFLSATPPSSADVASRNWKLLGSNTLDSKNKELFSANRIQIVNAALSSSTSAASDSFCLPVSADSNVNNFELLCPQEEGGVVVTQDEIAKLEVGQKLPNHLVASLVSAHGSGGEKPRFVRSRKPIQFTTLDDLLQNSSKVLFGASNKKKNNLVNKRFRVDYLSSAALVVMKLDVEGRELEIVKGARELFRVAPPHLVIAEQMRSHPHVLQFLKLFHKMEYVLINSVTGFVISPPSFNKYVESTMSEVENFFFLRRDVASHLCEKKRDPMFPGRYAEACGPNMFAVTD